MISVYFLLLPDTLLMDVAGPAEVFRLANQQLRARGRQEKFALHFISPEPQVMSSVGLGLHGLTPLPDLEAARTEGRVWLVLSGRSGQAANIIHRDPLWLSARHWLTRYHNHFLAQADAGYTLLTICAGALLLADAGLAAGRRLTTHHDFLAQLQRLAPRAQIVGNRLYVDDGNLLSSAGITAGIDLALYCVSKEAGEEVAAGAALAMRVTRRRHAEEPELSPLLAYRHHGHQALLRVQDAVEADPAHAWDHAALARIAHVSARQLQRIFRQALDLSPRQYVERVRLHRLEQLRASQRPDPAGIELAGFSGSRQVRRARDRQQKRLCKPAPQ